MHTYHMDDPHAPSFVDLGIDHVRAQPEYKLALRLARRVQKLAFYFVDKHKLTSLYDQLTRNSQSVLLNFAEAYGRARGHYQSALWIARGEVYECIAALDLCPPEVAKHLLPTAERLAVMISDRIKACPAPPLNTKWSGRRWE